MELVVLLVPFAGLILGLPMGITVALWYYYRNKYGRTSARIWGGAMGACFIGLFVVAALSSMNAENEHAWTAAVISPMFIMAWSWPVTVGIWIVTEIGLRLGRRLSPNSITS